MDDIQRGVSAKQLLENELLRETLNRMDEEYTAAWRAATTLEAREDCWRLTKCLEKFVQHLTSISTTGQIKERDREELEGRAKRGFRWPTL